MAHFPSRQTLWMEEGAILDITLRSWLGFSCRMASHPQQPVCASVKWACGTISSIDQIIRTFDFEVENVPGWNFSLLKLVHMIKQAIFRDFHSANALLQKHSLQITTTWSQSNSRNALNLQQTENPCSKCRARAKFLSPFLVKLLWDLIGREKIQPVSLKDIFQTHQAFSHHYQGLILTLSICSILQGWIKRATLPTG